MTPSALPFAGEPPSPLKNRAGHIRAAMRRLDRSGPRPKPKKVQNPMHSLVNATIALAGIVASAAACVTTENYAKSLSGYAGQSIDTVVADIGPPDSSFQNEDGSMVYEWEEISIEHYPRMFTSRTYIETHDGHVIPVMRPSQFGSEVNQIARICTTRFTTSADRQVQGIMFVGDGCRS